MVLHLVNRLWTLFSCSCAISIFSGLVTNVHISNCNQLLWDLPGYGGKCISEYRVRIFSGKTYGKSREKRVFKCSKRNLTLNWLPQNGTASIIVSQFVVY